MNKLISSQKPTLSIDLKRNLIRIHKATLNILGQPEYIQLLVNPDDRSIAIMKGFSSDKLAHHVKYDRIKKGQSCELYSTVLLNNLRIISNQFEQSKAYRIYGNYHPEYEIVKFSIDECILYGQERGINEQ